MQFKRCLAVALAAMALLSCAARAEGRYYIDVDLVNQIVTAYNYGGGRGEDNIARQMICSSGYDSLTPTGTYFMPEKKYDSEREEWYWFGEYEIYAKYASRIVNGILFHSVLYPSTSSPATWASTHALGSKASHGCIRLRVEDSKWIAENCPPGTCVHIFDDGEADEDLRELLLNASFSADEMDYADFKRGMCTLRRGSRFSKVADLQQRLIDLGYLADRADGIFGPNTEAAVKAWQRDAGYADDGVVTPDQLEEILSLAAPEPTEAAGAAAKPTEVPTVKPTATATATPNATAKPTEVPTAKPTATVCPTQAPTQAPAPDISQIPGTVALVRVSSSLNLRAEPDARAAILCALSDGAALQVLREGPVWSKVVCGEQTGWVGSDYIEIVRREKAKQTEE